MSAPTPAYIVICGHKTCPYMPERNVSEMDRASVVKDIADAQFDELIQVIEFNTTAGTSRDVTAEIALEVSAAWADDGEPLRSWQIDFVEHHLGMSVAAEFRRAA